MIFPVRPRCDGFVLDERDEAALVAVINFVVDALLEVIIQDGPKWVHVAEER